MESGALCVEMCKESGWLGEAVVVLVVGLRALWAERQRRKLAAEKAELETEKAELKGRVQLLSLRPPPIPVTVVQPIPEPVATALATQATVAGEGQAPEKIGVPGNKQLRPEGTSE